MMSILSELCQINFPKFFDYIFCFPVQKYSMSHMTNQYKNRQYKEKVVLPVLALMFCYLAMTSMVSAASAAGRRCIDSSAGSVAITVGMVVAAVITSVMDMPSFFDASFYSTDRAVGISCRYCLSVMMSVSRNWGDKEDGYQCDCSDCTEQFFD